MLSGQTSGTDRIGTNNGPVRTKTNGTVETNGTVMAKNKNRPCLVWSNLGPFQTVLVKERLGISNMPVVCVSIAFWS